MKHYEKDPRETERFYSPAPASGQGMGTKTNELLGTLNEDGDWEENEYVRVEDTIPEEGSREDDLINQIDADNDEYYIRAEESEVKSELLPPRRNRFRNGIAPSDAIPAVKDDLYAVMSSDDPVLDDYQGYVLANGAKEVEKIARETAFGDESVLSTAESRKRIVKKKGADWATDSH